MPPPISFSSDPADVLRRSLQDLDRRTHNLGSTVDALRTSLLGLDNATKSSSHVLREMSRIPMHIGHSFPHLVPGGGSLDYVRRQESSTPGLGFAPSAASAAIAASLSSLLSLSDAAFTISRANIVVLNGVISKTGLPSVVPPVAKSMDANPRSAKLLAGDQFDLLAPKASPPPLPERLFGNRGYSPLQGTSLANLPSHIASRPLGGDSASDRFALRIKPLPLPQDGDPFQGYASPLPRPTRADLLGKFPLHSSPYQLGGSSSVSSGLPGKMPFPLPSPVPPSRLDGDPFSRMPAPLPSRRDDHVPPRPPVNPFNLGRNDPKPNPYFPSLGSSAASLGNFLPSVNQAAIALGVFATTAGVATSVFLKLASSASPSGMETAGKLFTLLAAQLGYELMPQLAQFIQGLHDAREAVKENKPEVRAAIDGFTDAAQAIGRIVSGNPVKGIAGAGAGAAVPVLDGLLGMPKTAQAVEKRMLEMEREHATRRQSLVETARTFNPMAARVIISALPHEQGIRERVNKASSNPGQAPADAVPQGKNAPAIPVPAGVAKEVENHAEWRKANRRLNDQQREAYQAALNSGKTPEEAKKSSGYRVPASMTNIPLEMPQTSVPKYAAVEDMYQQIQIGALKSSPLDQQLKDIQMQSFQQLQLILAEIKEGNSRKAPAVN